MSDLQKLGALVALLVGLITLGGLVWTASANFTQINSKLDYLVQSSEQTGIVLKQHDKDIGSNTLAVQELKAGALIYVYAEDTFLVVQTPKGKQLEIPISMRNRVVPATN